VDSVSPHPKKLKKNKKHLIAPKHGPAEAVTVSRITMQCTLVIKGNNISRVSAAINLYPRIMEKFGSNFGLNICHKKR
jgi:hypothetical protein